MTEFKAVGQIVQQQLALDTYLSALLQEIPDFDDQIGDEGNEGTCSSAEPETNQPESLPDQLVADQNQAKLYASSAVPKQEVQEFQVLFFKLEHLTLAAPLTELARTIRFDCKPCQIPGQPSWFMGLLDDQGDRLGILDTGQLLWGKSHGAQRDLVAKPFKSILVTQDKRWGLACDEILSVIRLRPENIRWRKSRQKRPWLIGTTIEELTAIIDLQELVPHRKRHGQ